MRILFLSAFVKSQIAYNESENNSIDEINERKHEASKEMVKNWNISDTKICFTAQKARSEASIQTKICEVVSRSIASRF